MQHMRGQAERFGATFEAADVSRVDFSERPFGVWVDDEEHRAKSVIISTGASARWLDLPSESRLRGFGVSTCATCDGFFFRDKPMVVVGGGDSAMEEALLPRPHGVLGHHRPPARRVPRVADHGRPRARPTRRSTCAGTRSSRRSSGDDKVEARPRPRHRDRRARGHPGRRDVRRDRPRPQHRASSPARSRSTRPATSSPTARAPDVEGVFACGDVQDTVYRQAITAAGSGCMAAMDAERWLEARPAHTTAGSPRRQPRHRKGRREWRTTCWRSPLDNFQGTGAREREAGAGRLLGGVVRAVPHGRPRRRADRQGALRHPRRRQAERGRDGAIAQRYNVQGIPFLGLFEHGQLARHAVGAMPKAQLERALGLE